MDESEIWLSDEDEEFDEGDEATTDPTFFSIGLTQQGQPGGKSDSNYFLLARGRR